MKFNLLVFILALSPLTTFAGLSDNIEAECSIEKGLMNDWKGWRFTPTSKGKEAYDKAKESYDACVESVTARFNANATEDEEVVANEQNNCVAKRLRGESCD